MHRVLKEYNVRPDIRYITVNEFSSISMVEHELGLTILPGLLLRGRFGEYVIRSITPRVYRRLGLAYSSPGELAPASKIFLKYAKDFLLDG